MYLWYKLLALLLACRQFMRRIFWKGFINSVLFVGGNGQATSTSDRWMTRELQITSDQTASINTKDSAVS